MLDFIQNKLFSNYQLPKSMLPPVYRPSPKANSTHNQPEQQNNNNNNSRNQGFNTAASPVKNNPFQLTTGAIGVTTPLPTEDDGITPLSGINSIARTEAVLSKSITNNNPFLLAQTDPAKQLEQLGQNRPFNKPIFLGYRDNIALYGASKLFVLC
jgi:hypothetical protein